MNYGLLTWPHANARYQAEAVRLARAELIMMLDAICPGCVVGETRQEINLIEFTTPAPLTDAQIEKLSAHSLMYVLFDIENELLRPICGRVKPYLDGDLPGILKYKGKTNEMFTSMLINTALYASSFHSTDGRLRFADPMCSRGTALFQAVNRGWDADGTDISANDLKELDQFFKRYLEYHRIKHTSTRKSYTAKGAGAVSAMEFSFAADIETYKTGSTHMLRTAQCDCAMIPSLFGKKRYHIMACDLPYGVQHSSGTERFDKLLARALPAWREALKPGGAIAMSFNTNTLKTTVVRQILADSGFAVMSGGLWDTFPHWVEQAVTRDIAVGVRPGTE